MYMIKSGVYKITNTVNGKFYIGSTKDLDGRKVEHWQALKRGNHINVILQRSWNKHGESMFTFTIVEECSVETCREREQYYIDLLQPFKSVGYNINKSATGGDPFTYNPNKEEIRERMKIANGGENNGMYGHTHSNESIQKLKDKAKGRYSLEWFIERNGEEEGRKKFDERRAWLKSRKINYRHTNATKGTTVKVEANRGESVRRGKSTLKLRKTELITDIQSGVMTVQEIADKYQVSTTAVKYHRSKLAKI